MPASAKREPGGDKGHAERRGYERPQGAQLSAAGDEPGRRPQQHPNHGARPLR